MVTLRRDITSLTDAEWQRFVDALNAYKAARDPDTGNSRYDQHTMRHFEAMMELTLFPGETGTQRNAAHRGPVFGPWHRAALRELELALQAPEFDPWGPLLNPSFDPDNPPPPLGIPYCRFFGMGSSSAWQSHAVWDRMGHNGVATNSRRIGDGPFAHWNSVVWNNTFGRFFVRTGITRNFGVNAMPAPPTITDRSSKPYDAYPWNETQVPSFRRDLETRHNTVHTNIGGDMGAGTSPNDPVFWLHHANVDRLWAAWQAKFGVWNYAPNGEGPPGHNRFDEVSHMMQPITVNETLDLEACDIAYDSLT